jgi:4-amino-4-deoxy-L-arabinose transferase-like glycosyltransferase
MWSKDKYLIALLSAFVVVALLWSFAVPIGETPDEPDHWLFLRYVREQHRLPVYGGGLGQAHQMPLYYILLAPLATASPLPTPNVITDATGRTISADPPKIFGNYKGDLFGYRPWRIVRLASVVFAGLVVWLCYLTGAVATGRRSTGLLAGGIAGFLPEFAFRSGSVSNDLLAIAFAAAAVYFMVKILKQGFTWRSGVLGIVSLGLGYITKAHLVFLLAPWTLTLLLASGAPRDRRRRLALLGLFLVIAAGPLIRNLVLFGDPFLLKITAGRTPDYIPRSLFSEYFFTTYPFIVVQSFIANFGFMNLLAPPFVYHLFLTLGLAAAAGVIMVYWKRRLDPRIGAVLLLTAVLNYVFIMWVNLTFNQPQGRYLFPSLTAIAVLAAAGLESLPGWRPAATTLCVVLLCLINLYLIRFLIVPTYWSFPSLRQELADKPVGRIAGDFTVGQTFVSPCATLNRIDVVIGTYVMRNEGSVTLSVAEPGVPEPITRTTITAAGMPNNMWVPFDFWPVENALGRRFYFQLASPDAPRWHGVAVYVSSQQQLPGEQLFIKNVPTAGSMRFRAYCSEDWGSGYLWKAVRVLAGKVL